MTFHYAYVYYNHIIIYVALTRGLCSFGSVILVIRKRYSPPPPPKKKKKKIPHPALPECTMFVLNLCRGLIHVLLPIPFRVKTGLVPVMKSSMLWEHKYDKTTISKQNIPVYISYRCMVCLHLVSIWVLRTRYIKFAVLLLCLVIRRFWLSHILSYQLSIKLWIRITLPSNRRHVGYNHI